MEIKEIFDIADANSANSDSVLLPQSHNGRKLQYRIKKKNEVFRFILIIPLIIAVVIIEKRSMHAGRKKKSQEELTRAYPEIISKLSLLTGAGMTPYNALRRLMEMERLTAGWRLLWGIYSPGLRKGHSMLRSDGYSGWRLIAD